MPNGPPNNEWNAGNISGSGIFIVHNSAHNASIKNANGTYNPPSQPLGFSGIMIADDATHLNLDFWGAIMLLSPNPQGNVFGTGNAVLRFSRQSIKSAIGVLKNGSQVNILAWYE